MKELIEQIYSCRSRHNCLKEWANCHVPEPFIGNLHSRFAIIGANPGSYGGQQRSFKNLTDYVNYHEKEFCKSAFDWVEDYCEAYSMLVNPGANLTVFNENAIILNVIKCSTKIKLSEIPKLDKEQAKNNCIDYLIQQLENMQPSIILAHGRFACDAIMGILRSGTNYEVDEKMSSHSISTLQGLSMEEISREYIIAKNKKGRKTLFLFNWHLSWWGKAKKRLNYNIEQKRRIINELLSMPE
jgi:uracil-DNA glycosylase